MTTTTALTDGDREVLSHWHVGRKPFTDWLADSPDPGSARSLLIRYLDRGGPGTLLARLTAEYLGLDPVHLYAENWPRKAARLAAGARAKGDDPHAEKLHAALVALMFCANCGRPLEDPVAVDRGIGPDCWRRIDPQWRDAITGRLALPETEGTLW